jgi:uncharacterized membrane-anchored protein YhcB (DUF1043 family)
MFASMPLLQQVVDKTVVSLLVAAIGGFLVWPFKVIKRKVEEFTTELKAVQTELVTQRTNHLSHIEASAEAQLKVLEKVSNTLTDIHLDQKETLGYIKAREK